MPAQIIILAHYRPQPVSYAALPFLPFLPVLAALAWWGVVFSLVRDAR